MAKKTLIFVGLRDWRVGLDYVDAFTLDFPFTVEDYDEEKDEYYDRVIRNMEELEDWAERFFEVWEIRELED